MTDRLQQLLQRADAVMAAPVATADVASGVRGRLSRQRKRRAAFGLAAIILAGIGLAFALQKPDRPAVAVQTGTRDLSNEIARLQIEAAIHQRTADVMMSLRKPAPPPAQKQATERSTFPTDRAALILVYEADRYLAEKQPASAVASYKRAIELFPNTHWAKVARQRLKQMRTEVTL